MKKRKGKQAQPEGAIPSEEPETTTAAPVPADAVLADGVPEDETVGEAAGAVVAEVSEDDVTSRMDLRGSRKARKRVNKAEAETPLAAAEATAPEGAAPEGAAPEGAVDEDTVDEDTAPEGALDDSASDEEPTVVDGRPATAETTLTDGGGPVDGGSTVAAESETEGFTENFTEQSPDGLSADSPPESPPMEGPRLESILESILFAADRPLGITDLKRLLGERDGKRLTAALESVRDKRADSGIQLVSVAGGWQLRTHPGNGLWVSKLVAGRPPRLSRAMMETLSIVAYRQPITRPEIDEIRGVDCGPVLHTLLDRGLIRVIGKKEEVGRPMLYGTTPEFLKTFSLKDLADLPTLREFHELGAEDRARVDATAAEGSGAAVVAVTDEAGMVLPAPAASGRPGAGELSDPDPDEEDALLDALDQAASAAARATASPSDPAPEAHPDGEGVAGNDAPVPSPSPGAGE